MGVTELRERYHTSQKWFVMNVLEHHCAKDAAPAGSRRDEERKKGGQKSANGSNRRAKEKGETRKKYVSRGRFGGVCRAEAERQG